MARRAEPRAGDPVATGAPSPVAPDPTGPDGGTWREGAVGQPGNGPLASIERGRETATGALHNKPPRTDRFAPRRHPDKNLRRNCLRPVVRAWYHRTYVRFPVSSPLDV